MKKVMSRKWLLVGLVLVLVLAGAGVAYAVKQNNESKNSPTATTPATGTGEIPPATDEEKQAAEEHKDDLVNQQNIENQPAPAGGKEVTPVIVNSFQQGAQIVVSGFIGGVFESGGTCTFTFTKDGATVAKTSTSFANVSTTDCQSPTVNRSEFPSAGTWNLVLSYQSPAAHGSSAAKQITLQ